MLRMLPLLLLAAFLSAGEIDAELPRLLDRLARGDADAPEEIAALGPEILPALEKEIERNPSPEMKARLAEVVEEIRRRKVLETLDFAVAVSRREVPLDVVNGTEFRFVIRAANRGEEDVVIWPYFSLQVVDPHGNEIKPASSTGRWGRGNRYLDAVPFVRLQPGAHGRWSTTTGLRRYTCDPENILGWQIPGPGVYTLRVTYDYDRAKIKERFPIHPDVTDEPTASWNNAVELRYTFFTTLNVTP